MNYSNIKFYDIANGYGVRTSLFVSGCRNHCKNCFNQETWDFNYGNAFTKEVEDKIINSISSDFIDGLTILGGEPFELENQQAVLNLIKRVRKELPSKTIWCFSGFTLEELKSGSRATSQTAIEILNNIDVLVDGRFVEELKKITLKFRGSENQRVIDMKKTISKGEVVLWSDSHE